MGRSFLMAWNPNIPQATDALSQSQADILANFQALDSLFDGGVQNFVLFPVQTSDPTTSSTEVALYSKIDSATSNQELFFRRTSSGQTIDCTGSNQATSGWSYLPSGLLIKWGTGTTTQNTLATQAFPGAPAPTFNNVFMVSASQTFAAGPSQSTLNNALCVG